MKGPDSNSAGRTLDPRGLLQSSREISTVSGREAILEDRFAAGIDRHAAFGDIAHEYDGRRSPIKTTHRVLVGASSGPRNREGGESGMTRRTLQPGTVVAFVRLLEPVDHNRLHRPAPHPNRTREFSEESCGGIESESAAESRRTDSGPQPERWRLNRAPPRDHSPGPHVHGDGAAILLVGGLDAPHLAAFDVDRIRLRVEQEPSSRAVRVRKIGDERGLLRIVDAAEEAEVAAASTAVHIPRDHVVVDAESIAKRFTPATQDIVRRIDDALVDAHVESTPNLVDDRAKGGRGHPGQAALPLPFVSGPPWRLETRHPVDRRAAARGLSGEVAERKVAGCEDGGALE